MSLALKTLFIALFCSACAIARADEGAKGAHQAPPSSKELDRMKQLAGTWKGVGAKDNAMGETVVTYRVTSGGTAVVETISPGTPHEMVTMYADEGGKLTLTHYCTLGNQPHMQLVKSDDKTLGFELQKGGAIDPQKDVHMHALTLTWVDKDHVNADWVNMAGGKEASHAVFTLARADAPKPAK